MKYLKTFVGAVLAGLAIGIGGVAYLLSDSKVVGAVLFAVGLYIICTQGLMLFTGKVGYLVNEKPVYLLELLVIWLGNFVGTGLIAFLMCFTRFEAKLFTNAVNLIQIKQNDSLFSLFVLGIFCGILMYAAVDGYKKTQNPLIIFACVAGFIICGFEHCIADMFYFIMAGYMSLDIIAALLIITAGNTLGGVLIPLYTKLASKDKTEKK